MAVGGVAVGVRRGKVGRQRLERVVGRRRFVHEAVDRVGVALLGALRRRLHLVLVLPGRRKINVDFIDFTKRSVNSD